MTVSLTALGSIGWTTPLYNAAAHGHTKIVKALLW